MGGAGSERGEVVEASAGRPQPQPQPPPGGRRHWGPGGRFTVCLLAIALAGLAARVAYVWWVAPTELGADAAWYRLVAGGVAHGDGYVDPEALYGSGARIPTATFPPLWPAVLAAVIRLGVEDQRQLQLVGAVVGAISVGLVGLLGRRVASPSVGLVAAAVLAVSPMVIAGDGSMMAEPLFTALVTGALLLVYATSARPTWGRIAVMGVLAGLLALTRGEGVLIGTALVAVALLRAHLGWRRLLAGAGVALLAFVVVVAPWTLRNLVRFDDVVPLSLNAGSLLEGANCPSTYDGPLLGAWDYECLTEIRERGPLPDASATSARRGLEHAWSEAGRLPVVAGARVLRTWGLWDPSALLDAEVVETRDRGWQRTAWGVGLVITAVGAAGVVVAVRQRRDVVPLLTVIGAVTLTAVLSWGNQRFRLAAAPAVAVFVAIALVAGWQARRRRGEPAEGGSSAVGATASTT